MLYSSLYISHSFVISSCQQRILPRSARWSVNVCRDTSYTALVQCLSSSGLCVSFSYAVLAVCPCARGPQMLRAVFHLRVAGRCSRWLPQHRAICVCTAACQKASVVSDPIQQLFLDKIREYSSKSRWVALRGQCPHSSSQDVAAAPPSDTFFVVAMLMRRVYRAWCTMCTRHGAPCVPGMVHRVYQAWCTRHGAPCVPGMVHRVYLAWCTVCTRHGALCVPGMVHCVYQAWCTVCTRHGALCVPGMVHCVYQAWCTVCTRHGALCVPGMVHRVYRVRCTEWTTFGTDGAPASNCTSG